MKTIRNIILVIIFGALIGFTLYIAPNYKKDPNENVTNLVINYTNVTGKMNGKVIIDDNETIYLSLDDIENYYDRYIFFEKQYNYIIATANGKTACFDIKNQTLTINDKKEKCKIINQDDKYYIPITALESVYNINVKYVSDYNTVVIDSLDKQLETAKTNKEVWVKSKNIELSRTLEKLQADTTVSIVPNDENKDYKGWTLVKNDNGKIGYIKSENLTDFKTERSEEKEEQKTISIAWEYFSKVAKAPKNDITTKYDGIIRNGRNCYGIVICNIFNFYHAIFPKANYGCDLLWKTS